MTNLLRPMTPSVKAALVGLAGHWPSAALRLCDLAAIVFRIGGSGLRLETMRRLFPALDEPTLSRAWREACRIRLRGRIMRELSFRTALTPGRAVPSDALRSLRGPAILATFHVGAIESLGLALDQAGAPVLAFRGRQANASFSNVTVSWIDRDDPQQRALNIYDAVRALQRGEIVMLALDGGKVRSLDIPCLGHTLKIARGAFALARITGAPVIPIVARWHGTDVDVVAGEALFLSNHTESDAARRCVQWLEGYLLASPAQIGPGVGLFIR